MPPLFFFLIFMHHSHTDLSVSLSLYFIRGKIEKKISNLIKMISSSSIMKTTATMISSVSSTLQIPYVAYTQNTGWFRDDIHFFFIFIIHTEKMMCIHILHSLTHRQTETTTTTKTTRCYHWFRCFCGFHFCSCFLFCFANLMMIWSLPVLKFSKESTMNIQKRKTTWFSSSSFQ